jgi:TPR repeat protein
MKEKLCMENGSQLAVANSEYGSGNYEQAFNIYKSYAERGNVDCSCIVGWMYLKGVGVGKSIAYAENFFSTAASIQNLEAIFGLAKCHMAEDRISEAVEVLSELAEQDYPPSNYWLGRLHEEGRGVVQDRIRALQFYSLAARHKHLYASRREAYLLIQGQAGFMGVWVGILKLGRNILNAISIARGEGLRDPRLLI